MAKRRVFTEEEIKQIEADYKACVSTYDIGKKHNTSHAQISKMMNSRGLYRGRGNKETRKNADAQKRAEGKRLFEEWLTAEYGNRFTCLEYINHKTPYKLHCNECGSEFTRWPDKTQAIRCPTCYEKQLEQKRIEKEREKLVRKKLLAEEYAKEKKCCNCGLVFHSESPEAKYCSDRCSRRAYKKRIGYRDNRDRGHRARAKRHGVEYDPTITWRSLSKELGHCNCQICGEPCDPNDTSWNGNFGPLYPTVDCIVPMAKGGGYVHGNVQLAHAICNSCKRDLAEDELTDEVITHAKEQAIANKCA